MKTLLVLGCGLEQGQIYRRIKKALPGIYIIGVDGNRYAEGQKYCDIFIHADINDINKITSIGKQHNVDGVYCFALEKMDVVSRVGINLGLNCITPKLADICTQKDLRIKRLDEFKVNIPRYYIATSIKQAERFFSTINNDCVIKPVDSAGARGVKKVNNVIDIKNAFLEAVKFSKKRKVLIEECLKGIELSTETVVFNGNFYHTGYADRNYEYDKYKPYFVENGHIQPSKHDKLKSIVELEIERAILALNGQIIPEDGVYKGDILVTKNKKAYILEMACRQSGGWFANGNVIYSSGVDIAIPLTIMALALDSDFYEEEIISMLKGKQKFYACQRYIIPDKDFVFKGFKGISEAKKSHGVVQLDMFHIPKKGEKITKAINNTQRFGHIIAIGKTYESATRNCENAIKKIRF